MVLPVSGQWCFQYQVSGAAGSRLVVLLVAVSGATAAGQ